LIYDDFNSTRKGRSRGAAGVEVERFNDFIEFYEFDGLVSLWKKVDVV
jgi:hypothetical protein